MGSWVDIFAVAVIVAVALPTVVALLNANRRARSWTPVPVGPMTVEQALRHAYIVRDEIGHVGFAQLHGWAADLGVLGRKMPPSLWPDASTVDAVLDVITTVERENARRECRRNPQTVEDFTMNMAEDWAMTTVLIPRIGTWR